MKRAGEASPTPRARRDIPAGLSAHFESGTRGWHVESKLSAGQAESYVPDSRLLRFPCREAAQSHVR